LPVLDHPGNPIFEEEIRNKLNMSKMKKYFFLLLIMLPSIFNECRADKPANASITGTSGNNVVVQMTMGALPKDNLVKAINEILLIK
jgi:hypothetical protein